MLYVYTEEQRQQRLKDMNSDWLMKILQDPSQPAMLLMPVCVFCQIVAVTMTLLQVFFLKIIFRYSKKARIDVLRQ